MITTTEAGPAGLAGSLGLEALPLLRLLQLVSPALPVGAYSYSRGLEWAVQAGWVRDAASAQAWIAGLLRHAVARLDVPLLARLMAAWGAGDAASVLAWSQRLLAMREAAEFQAEERQQGAALARLLASLGEARARAWQDDPACTWVGLFALAAVREHIPEQAAALGYLWAWAENQVLAAIKLVPLGQTAGQSILAGLGALLVQAAQEGLALSEEEIGQVTPGLALASIAHETQYTRLFRS